MDDEKTAVRKMLIAMDIVYGKDEDCPEGDQVLNMNDVWGWAAAWGEHIPDDELIELGHLLRCYGYCGALYWVSERHNQMRSKFEDINRFVEFVRHEETIVQEEPNSSKRAYLKRSSQLEAHIAASMRQCRKEMWEELETRLHNPRLWSGNTTDIRKEVADYCRQRADENP